MLSPSSASSRTQSHPSASLMLQHFSSPSLDPRRGELSPLKTTVHVHQLTLDPELSAAAGVTWGGSSSNASLHSLQPSDAQLESYVAHLCKSMQSASIKDSKGRQVRRKVLEELNKLVLAFQLADLRALCDLFTCLLQPHSTDDRSQNSSTSDDVHGGLELLCACLEHQSSSGSRQARVFFFQLLAQAKSHMAARLLGLTFLTNNGRQCAEFAPHMAALLVAWTKDLEAAVVYTPTTTAAAATQQSASSTDLASSAPPSLQLTSSAASILQVPSTAPDSAVFTFLQVAPQECPLAVHRALTNKLLLLLLRFVKYSCWSSTAGAASGGGAGGTTGEADQQQQQLSSLVAAVCNKAAFETDHTIQAFILPFIDIVVRAGVPAQVRNKVVYALCLCQFACAQRSTRSPLRARFAHLSLFFPLTLCSVGAVACCQASTSQVVTVGAPCVSCLKARTGYKYCTICSKAW